MLLNKYFQAFMLCCLSILANQAMDLTAPVNDQLLYAARHSNVFDVERCLNLGANSYVEALHEANRCFPIMQCLVEHVFSNGVDNQLLMHQSVRQELNEELRCAAIWGNLDIVQYLLELPKEQRPDVHANNDEALQAAAVSGHLAVVMYLLQHGADHTKLPNYTLKYLYAHIPVMFQNVISREEWHEIEQALHLLPIFPDDVQLNISKLIAHDMLKLLEKLSPIVSDDVQLSIGKLISPVINAYIMMLSKHPSCNNNYIQKNILSFVFGSAAINYFSRYQESMAQQQNLINEGH